MTTTFVDKDKTAFLTQQPRTLAPGIVAYGNVMPNTSGLIRDIETLVSLKQLVWSPGQQGSGTESKDGTVDKSIRDVEVMSLPPFQKTPAFRLHGGAEEVLSNKLDEVLLPLLQRYQDSNGVGGKLDNEGWQILKYGVGQHFGRHSDHSKHYPRTVSVSFYLNDDYKGGELEFDAFNVLLPPVANEAVFFPSSYVYTHRVHPVTVGVRYCVVGWFY